MDLTGPSPEHWTDSQPMCFGCKHLIEWPYCLAFLTGEGIPEEIGRGKWDHTLPYPGDHGILFTPLDSPYLLSEDALKHLLANYRGQRIMPMLVDQVQTPPKADPALPHPLARHPSFGEKTDEWPDLSSAVSTGLGSNAEVSGRRRAEATFHPGDAGHSHLRSEDPSPAAQVTPQRTLEHDALATLEIEVPELFLGTEPEPTGLDLILACAKGNEKMAESLLDRGVAVNARDSDHNTALMIACRNCHLEVVSMLIERGADVNATNKYGKTALDIAADWGYPSIINLLRKHGGRESESW